VGKIQRELKELLTRFEEGLQLLVVAHACGTHGEGYSLAAACRLYQVQAPLILHKRFTIQMGMVSGIVSTLPSLSQLSFLPKTMPANVLLDCPIELPIHPSISESCKRSLSDDWDKG